MLKSEFDNQFKELLAEYVRLNGLLKETVDNEQKMSVMRQMQDVVRRQNALRKEYANNQGEN